MRSWFRIASSGSHVIKGNPDLLGDRVSKMLGYIESVSISHYDEYHALCSYQNGHRAMIIIPH